MKRLLLVAVAVLAAGCGPATAFDGAWTGSMTIPIPVLGTERTIGTTVTAESYDGGHLLTLHPVCPDATGYVIATVDAHTATWDGGILCTLEDHPWPECPATVLTYDHLTAEVSGDGDVLTMAAQGDMIVCDVPHPVAVRWDMRRLP